MDPEDILSDEFGEDEFEWWCGGPSLRNWEKANKDEEEHIPQCPPNPYQELNVSTLLREIRVLIESVIETSRGDSDATQLAEAFEALDEKIKSGDQLPADWRRQRLDIPIESLSAWAERDLTDRDVLQMQDRIDDSSIPGEIWYMAQETET